MITDTVFPFLGNNFFGTSAIPTVLRRHRHQGQYLVLTSNCWRRDALPARWSMVLLVGHIPLNCRRYTVQGLGGVFSVGDWGATDWSRWATRSASGDWSAEATGCRFEAFFLICTQTCGARHNLHFSSHSVCDASWQSGQKDESSGHCSRQDSKTLCETCPLLLGNGRVVTGPTSINSAWPTTINWRIELFHRHQSVSDTHIFLPRICSSLPNARFHSNLFFCLFRLRSMMTYIYVS